MGIDHCTAECPCPVDITGLIWHSGLIALRAVRFFEYGLLQLLIAEVGLRQFFQRNL
ncbi:hypothetical protein D9M69_489720 [compost metagenome]